MASTKERNVFLRLCQLYATNTKLREEDHPSLFPLSFPPLVYGESLIDKWALQSHLNSLAAMSAAASHIDLAVRNMQLQQANDALAAQLNELSGRLAETEAELERADLAVVPPRDFLPPGFYEMHSPVIDAILDYAFLHRYARHTLGARRGGALGQQGAPATEIEHLRARVAALAAENLHLKTIVAQERRR